MQMLLSVLVGNTVVACILASFALVAARMERPALAHVAWLLVMIKLLTPPIWHISVPSLSSDDSLAVVATVRPAPVARTMHVPAESLDNSVAPVGIVTTVAVTPAPRMTARSFRAIPWQLGALALWGMGSIGWLLLATIRTARFHRLLRDGHPADADLTREVAGLAARMGLKRAPCVRLVCGSFSPMLWFLGRRATLVAAG